MRVPKEDWGFLNEKAFEAALQASVPERLPDKVAAAVTPWKRAMGRVLAGTALTTLGTNLWGLNYPLPGIGLVLMLLGFRSCGRRVILIFFHSTARRPATGAEQKNWKFTVYRISHLASHLTRHGAAFGKAAHPAGCSTRQGTPSGRVLHSTGYTIWQDTPFGRTPH